MQGLRGRLTPADVVICSPRDIGQIEDIAGRTFWYFGNDYARFLEIKAGLLASVPVVPVGDIVNEAAGRIAPELIELDAKLATGKHPLAWVSSDLAERSPYTSSFYLDCCRCVALVEALRRGGKHLVIADDAAFGRALTEVCKDNGFSSQWRGSTNSGRWLLTALRTHVGFLMRWFSQRRAFRSQAPGAQLLAGCDPLLMSWAEGAAGSQTEDRYFRALPGWLRASGARLGWIYNPVSWLNPNGTANVTAPPPSNEPRVLVSGLFDFGTLARAYASLFAFPFSVKRDLEIGGVNLSQLLRLAVRRELSSSRLVAAALYAGVAKALRRAGVLPRRLIYTFENQPWEKSMLFGFRRALSQTRLIGVQHASIAERYLSGHPSQQQWSGGTAPDLIVTVGSEFRERLVEQGAPPDRVVTGGSLRYAVLISSISNTIRGPLPEKLVLATCSMEPKDSFELAHKASVATAGMPGVRLAINFHPMAEAAFRETIQKRLMVTADCTHVDFVSGSAVDWMKKADVLLYNSSSTAFEAAAMGLPMIYVGPDTGLDLDNMSSAKIPRGRSPEDVRRHVVALLSDQAIRESVVGTAQDYLRRCFSVPARDFWVALAR